MIRHCPFLFIALCAIAILVQCSQNHVRSTHNGQSIGDSKKEPKPKAASIYAAGKQAFQSRFISFCYPPYWKLSATGFYYQRLPESGEEPAPLLELSADGIMISFRLARRFNNETMSERVNRFLPVYFITNIFSKEEIGQLGEQRGSGYKVTGELWPHKKEIGVLYFFRQKLEKPILFSRAEPSYDYLEIRAFYVYAKGDEGTRKNQEENTLAVLESLQLTPIEDLTNLNETEKRAEMLQYREDLEVICHLEERAATAGVPEDEAGQKMGAYLEAHVRSPRGVELLEEMAGLSPNDRGLRLRNEANNAGLSACPFAEKLLAK